MDGFNVLSRDVSGNVSTVHLLQQFQRLRHRADLLHGELQFVVDLLECRALGMVHDVLHDLHIGRALKVFRGLVADKIRRHVVVAK